MSRATRAAATALGCALAVSALSAGATAQTTAPPTAQAVAKAAVKAQDAWRFTITPYAWLPGLTGQVGIGPLQTSTSLTPHDILRHLRFAAMGTAEARKGPWILGTDVIYISLGTERVVAIRGDTGQFNLTAHEWIVQPVVGYGFGDQTYGVDLLLGARFWSFKPTLVADRPNGLSSERTMTKTWGDPTGGLRAHATITTAHPIRLVAGADGGGVAYSGSKSTWQLYAKAGVDVAFNWTVSAGYRALSVDYQPDNFLDNTHMRGFIAEAAFRF